MRDPKKVAQEFKAINIEKMSAITSAELEVGGWDKPVSGWITCPNVMSYIDHINRMSDQIRDDVLLCSSLEEQKEMYQYYANMLKESASIGDYQTASAIYYIIGTNSAITSLSKALGNPETEAILKKCDALFEQSNDQGNLKKATKESNAKQTTVPLFSMTLKKILTADGIPVPDEKGPERDQMLDNVRQRKEVAITQFKAGIEGKKLPKFDPKLLEQHNDWFKKPKMTGPDAVKLSDLMKEGRGNNAKFWVSPVTIKAAISAVNSEHQKEAGKPKNFALLEFVQKEGTFRSDFLNQSEINHIIKMIEKEEKGFSKVSKEKQQKLNDLKELMLSGQKLGECSDKLKAALDKANGDPNKLGPEIEHFIKEYVTRLADYNDKYEKVSPLLNLKHPDKDVGKFADKLNQYIMSIRPAKDQAAALNVSQVLMMPVQRGPRFNLHFSEIVKIEKSRLLKKYNEPAGNNITANLENVSRLSTRLDNLEKSVAAVLKGPGDQSDDKRHAARQQVFDIFNDYKNAGSKLEFVNPDNIKIWKEQATVILNILNNIEIEAKKQKLSPLQTNRMIDEKIASLLETIIKDPNVNAYIKEDSKIMLADLQLKLASSEPVVIPAARSMVKQGQEFQDNWKDIMAKRQEHKKENVQPKTAAQLAKAEAKTLRKGEFEHSKRTKALTLQHEAEKQKSKAASKGHADHGAAQEVVADQAAKIKSPRRS